MDIGYKNRDEIMAIIRKDAEFFQRHEIIDYSLLIGVIKKDPNIAENRHTHDSLPRRSNSPTKLKSR